MRTGLRATLPVVVAAAAIASGGCMHAYKERVNQALWERELRLQEDCIYRLKWQLEDKQRELDEANQRAGTARKEADVFRNDNRSNSGPDLGPPPPFNPLRGGNTDDSRSCRRRRISLRCSPEPNSIPTPLPAC